MKKGPPTGHWYSCKSVKVVGDRVMWSLDPGGEYDFLGSCGNDPLVSFLGIERDADLERFVRTWGPLRWDASGIDPAADYWRLLRWLKALFGLFHDYKQEENWSSEAVLRTSLAEYGDAHEDVALGVMARDEKVYSLWGWRWREATWETDLEYGEDWHGWIAAAPLGELQQELRKCINGAISVPRTLRAEPAGGRTRKRDIGACWDLRSLEDALLWMAQNEAWPGPIRRCAECGKYFAQKSRKERKFCEESCAHRAANRAWWSRNSQKLRKESGR
jgi:hypothetical protein